MLKKTFRYCATHKEDEKYMQQMCAGGWAALKLTEGFWSFEKCEPGQYCYRIAYLRGKSKAETEEMKRKYAEEGIEFVSRYSFWAIFRSEKQFELYTPDEEREICRKIYAPMPAGAVISWLVFAAGIILSCRLSLYFLLLSLIAGTYGGICSYLALSYHKLLKEL